MPTNKPRVAVTLEPHTHEVIERLAVLQGRTRGAVIAELLDSVAPALGRTVALLEAAKEAPEQVKRGLRNVVEGVHQELVQASGDASLQLGIFLGQLGAEEGVDPHVVTRGSGSDETGGSATSRKRSKPSATKAVADQGKSKDRGVKDARSKRQI